MEIAQILAEREAQYGRLADHALLLEQFRKLCTPTHPYLWDGTMRVGLDYILGKICRLVLGNPSHADTWQDIAGYALLVAQTLESLPVVPPPVVSPPAHIIPGGTVYFRECLWDILAVDISVQRALLGRDDAGCPDVWVPWAAIHVATGQRVLPYEEP